MSHYETWPRGGASAGEPAQGSSERSTELARKAVRARGLTDPLGAKGFRDTSKRIRRESRARRIISFGSVAIFVASFGLISLRGASNDVPVDAAGGSDTGATGESPAGSSGAALLQPIRSSSAAPAMATSTPTPTATAARARSSSRSSLKPTATATATETPADTPAPTDTPRSSHVRSHSTG